LLDLGQNVSLFESNGREEIQTRLEID
jgi:hypothetical protein